MKIAFFFVVEGPTLEMQALLLADSLRRNTAQDATIIAYVPSDYVPSLTEFTRAFLEARRVEMVPLCVPKQTWRRPYPHGNKIIAAAQRRDADYSVFLDTDMCCAGDITPPILPQDARVFAAPEGVPTWGAEGDDWRRAYKYFRLPLPEERVQLMRQKRRIFYPYFNAGYIAFPERHPRTGTRFGDLWLQTAIAFDFGAKLPKKRPWLDQITLPLTMYRFGYAYEVMEEAYNFSTKARQNNGETVRLAHYHRDPGFLQWDAARRAFDLFAGDICATETGAKVFCSEEAFLNTITGRR